MTQHISHLKLLTGMRAFVNTRF